MPKEKQEKSKKQERPEEEQDATADAKKEKQELEETPTMVALTFDEYDALEKEVESLQAEVKTQKDGWLRARADLDNYRKRVQRDAARSYSDAMTSVLKIFLNVSDDLERALKNKPENEAAEGWVNGIELICQKLENQIKNQGVERLEVNSGDTFDPNIHEAITQEDNPDFKEGQIIDVVQPGYRISDRIIRPAKVRVAR